VLGAGAGLETVTLSKENLPEHTHNLRGKVGNTLGNQYYGIRNASGDPADTGAIKGLGGTAPNQAQYLPDSGGIDVPLGTTLSTPFNTMNPYLTINYIIYTGVTA
jgi:microcystin-dependent protein